MNFDNNSGLLWVELAHSSYCSAGFFAAQKPNGYSAHMPSELLRIALEIEKNMRAFPSFYKKAATQFNKDYGRQIERDDKDNALGGSDPIHNRCRWITDLALNFDIELEVVPEKMTQFQASYLLISLVLAYRPEFDGATIGMDHCAPDGSTLDQDWNHDLNIVEEVKLAWGIIRAAQPPTPELFSESKFIPTAYQKAILAALEGIAMRADRLVNRIGDRRKFFRQKKELESLGLIAHHKRLGFYRPDAPPPELK